MRLRNDNWQLYDQKASCGVTRAHAHSRTRSLLRPLNIRLPRSVRKGSVKFLIRKSNRISSCHYRNIGAYPHRRTLRSTKKKKDARARARPYIRARVRALTHACKRLVSCARLDGGIDNLTDR